MTANVGKASRCVPGVAGKDFTTNFAARCIEAMVGRKVGIICDTDSCAAANVCYDTDRRGDCCWLTGVSRHWLPPDDINV